MNQTLKCNRCGEIKPFDAFGVISKSKPYPRQPCLACEASLVDPAQKREDDKRYRTENKELLIARARERRQSLKHEVMQAYGGKCVCCGETEELLLNIDHIHNDGKAHRETLDNWHGNTARQTYKYLKDNGFPAGFQCLCFNCNIAKARYGLCPHEVRRRADGQPPNHDLEGPPELLDQTGGGFWARHLADE